MMFMMRMTDQVFNLCIEKKHGTKTQERKKRNKKEETGLKGKGNETEATCTFPIFCPYTPDSKLQKQWTKTAEDLYEKSKGTIRVKIVEQGGVPLRLLFSKSAPREKTRCDRKDCKVCSDVNTSQFICRKTSKGGIGYNAQCQSCLREGKISLYHGETSRTLYTRSKEHFVNKESGLMKHVEIHHPNEVPQFEIKPTGFFKDPLTRQINEGVRINNSKSDPGHLINSKSEFRQGQVPRVVVLRGL